MRNIAKDEQYGTFGEFIAAKRRGKEITSLQASERIGISPSYYCDIERGRRNPPDRETLERLVVALQLVGNDIDTFYDLAGKARGSEDDWRRFVRDLEQRPKAGG